MAKPIKVNTGTSTEPIWTEINVRANIGTGKDSTAEGYNTKATGDYSHTEGYMTTAAGQSSHAEGALSTASGSYSHAEGNSVASGSYAHAEGRSAASGNASHAEGYHTKAGGNASHAEGQETKALSTSAHAEGQSTVAMHGYSYSIAEWNTEQKTITTYETIDTSITVSNFALIILQDSNGTTYTIETILSAIDYSNNIVSLGVDIDFNSQFPQFIVFRAASDFPTHAEGQRTLALGRATHAEGENTKALGDYAHAEGYNTEASGQGSHTEGSATKATGDFSHTEGIGTIASADSTHAEGYETTASADSAHAEGKYTKALGPASHAEGQNTTATGASAHAEGYSTKATGGYSHAEGYNTTAAGNYSHSEGTATSASGKASHAEGEATTALGMYTHTEGKGTVALSGTQYTIASYNSQQKTFVTKENIDNKFVSTNIPVFVALYDFYSTLTVSETIPTSVDYVNKTIVLGNLNVDLRLNTPKYIISKIDREYPAHAEGFYTYSLGHSSHTEGKMTLAMGDHSHAEGGSTITSGMYSHAEGIVALASGFASHAEGNSTIASGFHSHAEGQNTTASGENSHAEGSNTIASNFYSHAEGSRTAASGLASHAEGSNTIASGDYSHAEGNGTNANFYGSHIMGQFGDASAAYSWNLANGTSTTAKGLAAKILQSGAMYADSTYNSTGADYAELFEWFDGNTENEDRVGYFVTLDGMKIRKATSNDTYILGIVSSNPSVIGDSSGLRWNGKYITDEWDRIQHEFVTISAETATVKEHVETQNEDGTTTIKEVEKVIEVIPERIEWQPKLNPDWNPDEPYVERIIRPEWDAIGMMGKLFVRDDGTCEVNGYAKPNDEGIATKSDSGYRVLRRKSTNIIEVLVK
ncbi:peptidase G2 autoproteolytic cleavage domain-containing protein [Paenibacillus medicaginis]|uniref:Peptidase G2 autoproteolytic cleavage domain-containing protein n=1 Tax=Paenibacillus medicaginis TaxID=1470560 RepID=A0ABV5BV02_9BACL